MIIRDLRNMTLPIHVISRHQGSDNIILKCNIRRSSNAKIGAINRHLRNLIMTRLFNNIMINMNRKPRSTFMTRQNSRLRNIFQINTNKRTRMTTNVTGLNLRVHIGAVRLFYRLNTKGIQGRQVNNTIITSSVPFIGRATSRIKVFLSVTRHGRGNNLRVLDLRDIRGNSH